MHCLLFTFYQGNDTKHNEQNNDGPYGCRDTRH